VSRNTYRRFGKTHIHLIKIDTNRSKHRPRLAAEQLRARLM
jgi:hypothetical protein